MDLRNVCLLLAVGLAPLAAVAESSPPTYAEDIAPILFERCLVCHRPGEVAPMSLMSYAEARPWARAIAREVESRRMPPFHADAPLGHFTNDPRLDEHQIALVTEWAASGAPRGDMAKLPPLPDFPTTGWQLGTPDLVVSFPWITLENEGDEEIFHWLYSAGKVADTFWFRAVELKTENRSLLHHANVFVTLPDEEVPAEGGALDLEARGTFRMTPMLNWLPGQEPTEYPEESPGRLTGGLGLVLDSHYVPPVDSARERVELGFYAANGAIRGFNKQLGVIAPELSIRPGQRGFVRTYRMPFEEDAIVTGFHTHMHYRGVNSRIRLIYPDGGIETVLRVPQWDSDWQRDYTLAEPMLVPKGTIAEFRGEWDNSTDNPNNPDPTAFVRMGNFSEDEMFNSVMYYRPQDPLDPPIRVVDGREVTGDSSGG